MISNFRAIVALVKAGGVLGVIALLLWGFVFLKGLGFVSGYDVFSKIKSSNIFSDQMSVNFDSIVEDVRQVEKLNVMRVCDAGIDEVFDGCRTNKNCVSVRFQYAGFVDLMVDLKETDMSLEPTGSCMVRFKKGIIPSEVRGLSPRWFDNEGNVLDDQYMDFNVTNETFFSSGDVKTSKAKLKENLETYQVNAVKRTALNPSNIMKAKKQVEELVAGMLLPIVGDVANIHFEWPAEEDQN